MDEQPTAPSMRLNDTQVHLEPNGSANGRAEALGLSLREIFDRITVEFQQAKWAVAIAIAAGIGIGIYYAWMINPVEWTGGAYTDLSPNYQQAVVDMAADLATYDPASPAVARFTHLYPGVELNICQQARTTADPDKQKRLRSLKFRVTGSDCNMTEQTEE